MNNIIALMFQVPVILLWKLQQESRFGDLIGLNSRRIGSKSRSQVFAIADLSRRERDFIKRIASSRLCFECAF